jgi:protein O-mannosyl-transferase
VVHAGGAAEALTSSYWPGAFLIDYGKLWRPLTIGGFTAEWRVFGDRPGAFHATNAVVHAGVSLLVLLLLCQWVGVGAAFAGAAVFAVHPVHTEAVANVVGLSELGAAASCLVGCLLYVRLGKATRSGPRVALSLGIAFSYLASLGFKEIGVTLPALLALLAWADGRGAIRPLAARLWRDAPLYALLAATLATYLVVRSSILGVLLGDVPAEELVGLGTGARLLTALSLWSDYARLLVLPLDLSADYGPAMRFPAHGFDGLVAVGTLVFLGFVAGAVRARRRAPLVALGLAWFALAMLPVSHFLFPAGILLGERTLYLPSIGVAFAVAGTAAWLTDRGPAAARGGVAVLAVVLVGFGVRTWLRNPDWRDNDAVVHALERDHPESHVVARMAALRDMGAGNQEAAVQEFDRAVVLRPNDFLALTEAAEYYEHLGLNGKAEDVVRQATRAMPTNPYLWAMLARLRVKAGDVEGGRRTALEGVAASRMWLPDLWAIVAECYDRDGRTVEAERARSMTTRGRTLFEGLTTP